MLKVTKDPVTGILEVIDSCPSFHRTLTRHWYYDLVNNRKSSHGRKGDTPDRAMSEADTEWCVRYYLPKAQ